MKNRICYFLGTYEDWGGASRALLNFIVRVDKNQFSPLVVLTQEGTLGVRLKEQGIPTVVKKKRDWNGNPVRFLRDVFDSILFFHKQKINLIHVNGNALGWRPPELIAAWLLRIPVLMHYHITTETPSPFLKYVTGVIAVSKNIADHSNFLSRPTRVIHNIADIDRFAHGSSIRTEFGFDSSNVIVGFLGQIKRIKGIELFLRLPSVITDSNIRFLIAGEVKEPDPEFREQFHQAIVHDPRIKYVGYRNDPENIYATADILVMPSQWEEPCAMVLFESAAARKPIIATRTGGTPEIITHNDNGFLFDREDFQALTAHVHQLIDSPQERERIGYRAREVVEQMFTSRPVQELQSIYLEAIEKRGLD